MSLRILNCVIKHHLNKYPESACIEMLRNNFYVNNLIKSHICPDRLLSLYQVANKIMCEGNFQLRSSNSIIDELRSRMMREVDLIVHNSPWEKVLGYLYSPGACKIFVSCSFLRVGVSTKKEIIFQNSVLSVVALSPRYVQGDDTLTRAVESEVKLEHPDSR